MKQAQNLFRGTFLTLLFTICTTAISAQTIFLTEAPKPADNPKLAGLSPWDRVCASTNFNEYFVSIKWAGTAKSDNAFILELSNSTGDFSSALELSKITDQNQTNEFTTSFALSKKIQGDGYKLRVRSTSPVAISPETPAYSMYYLGFTTNLHISPDGDKTTPGTLDVCDGGTTVLSIDNVPGNQLNTYRYTWFRSGTPIGSGASINVSTSGEYFVYIDYGDCTGSANTESNHIIINSGESTGVSIKTPETTALCEGGTPLKLEASIKNTNYRYTWYKDGAIVQAAKTAGYTYNLEPNSSEFPGAYSVKMSGAGICSETSKAIDIKSAGAFSVTNLTDNNLLVLPGKTQTLGVSTTAKTPSFTWYRNNTALPNSNAPSLEVTQAGTYYVAVAQTGGNCSSTTIKSEKITVINPTDYRLQIGYATPYTSCGNGSIVLETVKIFAVLAHATELEVTNDIKSAFSYEWYKDASLVPNAHSQSISLTNSSENGAYKLKATLDGLTLDSNTLAVQLASTEVLTISSTNTVYCNATDTISLTTQKDLKEATFSWERDGISVNATDSTYNAARPGTYRLVVKNGDCQLKSNEITITPLNEDLITLDIDGPVVFPEGSSKTITARGGTAYKWLDATNMEIGAASSITFTKEGNYLLVATIENCEVSKPISVSYLELFNIPNVITPNGDGSNDQWVLPNAYSNKSSVHVIIYNAQGKEVLNSTSYQNNWPESSTSFSKQNMVFYYVIKNAVETLKQGTITVIR